MKICHLILKNKYYDAIKAEKKDTEYRDNTEYWRRRILGVNPSGSDQATHVTLHRGYTSETMTFEIDYLVVPKPEEIDKKIEIHLGQPMPIIFSDGFESRTKWPGGF
jgi:hypothetical protein